MSGLVPFGYTLAQDGRTLEPNAGRARTSSRRFARFESRATRCPPLQTNSIDVASVFAQVPMAVRVCASCPQTDHAERRIATGSNRSV